VFDFSVLIEIVPFCIFLGIDVSFCGCVEKLADQPGPLDQGGYFIINGWALCKENFLSMLESISIASGMW